MELSKSNPTVNMEYDWEIWQNHECCWSTEWNEMEGKGEGGGK